MDIFNRKKVEELQRDYQRVKQERDRYRTDLAALQVKFEELGELAEKVPEDCKKGPWCAACEFVKTFHHIEYHGLGCLHTVTGYACGKGESCKNFVQKNFKEE